MLLRDWNLGTIWSLVSGAVRIEHSANSNNMGIDCYSAWGSISEIESKTSDLRLEWWRLSLQDENVTDMDMVDSWQIIYIQRLPFPHPSRCIPTPIANNSGRRISQVEEARNGRYIVSRLDTEMRAETLFVQTSITSETKKIKSDSVVAPWCNHW